MLQNILTNPLMSHGLLFMMSLLPFWTRTHTFSMEGQKSLGLNLKYLKLCLQDE